MSINLCRLEEAKAAFDAVEGAGFFERSAGPYSGYDSVRGALEREGRYNNCCIYGGDGFNRYFVRLDGTVVFSERHAHSGHTAKAVEAGFDLLDGLPPEQWR
jgi:hypothetical protein